MYSFPIMPCINLGRPVLANWGGRRDECEDEKSEITACTLGEWDPAAGEPLYKAQKSDFLKRKVANLRKYWRNWRNCARKVFAQIQRMR